VFEGRLDSLAGVTTRVAVKVIHPDYAHEDAFRELFITEARLSARLEHQNLVRVQQFNKEGDVYYLVMEFIDGLTFRKIISGFQRQGHRIPAHVIAELGRQVCEGLHYAHMLRDEESQPLGLVHRDIKPTNLMLNAQGVAKVLDFGISAGRNIEEATDGVKGTWGYMALEQADQKPVGAAADLFGVAVVLYEMAALAPLFPEKDIEDIRKALVSDEAARRANTLTGAYADLGRVLVRALQRDPAARHSSAQSLANALSTLVPDSVGAQATLVRLVRDLRLLDPSTSMGSARASPGASRDSLASSSAAAARASSSAAARAAPAPLPVQAGDAHGPSPRSAAPPAAASSSPGWSAGLLGAGGGLLVGALALGALIVRTPQTSSVPVNAPAPLTVGATAEQAPTLAPPPQVAAQPLPQASVPNGPSRPDPATAPALVTAPTAPVVVGPAPAPEPLPAGPATPTADIVVAPTAEARPLGTGRVSISAVPRAQISIDGTYVRYTPLYDYSLSAGTHEIILQTDTHQTKRFTLTVPEDGNVTRVWFFDRQEWGGN
jgi:serine/threonine-protein kinase